MALELEDSQEESEQEQGLLMMSKSSTTCYYFTQPIVYTGPELSNISKHARNN
jgi:hypothetical protein